MNKICEKIAFKIVESEAETGTYGNIEITVDKDHNLEDFIGAPPICSGEHDLKYYSLFQKYLKVYEVWVWTIIDWERPNRL